MPPTPRRASDASTPSSAAQQARQQQLAHSVGGLSSGVASLQGQIALVQRREADVRAQLARDRAALAAVHGKLTAERARVRALRATLAYARMLLSRQLLSSYEGGKPDLVSVVLESNGFAQLLDQVNFLHDAMSAQQRIINVTRTAKALADAAAARLAGLERNDAQLVDASAMQARALAGMDSLLGTKEAALARALSAQEAALQASRNRGSALQTQITQIRAQQAAAAAAAAAQARAARARAARRRRAVQRAERVRSHQRSGRHRPGAGTVGRLGDPLLDRAVRVRRPGPAAQQRRRLGLLPDHAGHLEAVRRQRSGRLPGAEVRAGRRGEPHLGGRLGRVELGLRRDRRDPLSPERCAAG